MDTKFYTLNSHRTKVSGGDDLISVSTDSKPASDSDGDLLDFELCRLRLERKALLEQAAMLSQDEPSPSEEEPEGPQLVPLQRKEEPGSSQQQESLRAFFKNFIRAAAFLGVSIAATLFVLSR